MNVLLRFGLVKTPSVHVIKLSLPKSWILETFLTGKINLLVSHLMIIRAFIALAKADVIFSRVNIFHLVLAKGIISKGC